MDPDTQNHHDIIFLNCLVIHFFLILWLQCLTYYIWKCAQTMQTPLHHCQQQSLSCLSFFPHFLAIFTSVTILGNVHRLCKRCINIITKSLHHVYLFLLIFLDFLAIFTSITILGNAHRPCKQYINIVDSSLCHATRFFSDLFLVFWAYLHQLPYQEMHIDHVNNSPTLSTPVYIIPVLFLLILPDFLIIFVLITIFGNVHRPCKQYSNIGLHHVYSFSPEFS